MTTCEIEERILKKLKRLYRINPTSWHSPERLEEPYKILISMMDRSLIKGRTYPFGRQKGFQFKEGKLDD